MAVLSLIIILCLAILSGAWSIWPKRTLWWLLQKHTNQRFTPNYHHVNYLPKEENCIILCSNLNLFVAIIITRISGQSVTVPITETCKYHGLINRLVVKSKINIISPKDIGGWDEKGILLVKQRDYDVVTSFSLPIIPLEVCGTENLVYSEKATMARWLHLSFYQPLDVNITEKERLDLLSNYNIYAWEFYISLMPTIPELCIRQAKRLNKKMLIADSTGVELNGIKFLTAVFSMSKILEPHMRGQGRVGICLPPSVGGSMALMCVLLQGKTMVNLNYTASCKALHSAIEEAQIKTIITSGKFIEQLKTKGFFLEDVFANSNIVLLEDIKQQIDKITLLSNLIRVKFYSAENLIKRYVTKVSTSHTAAILFSSGSEGKPKGVELTHKNLIGNIKQGIILLQANENDIVLSILPIFHAFGLTATALLPLVEGLPMICHPDPTDGAVLGKLVKKYKATLLTGTSTFYRLYVKNRHITPDMFESLRLVIAGAEKLLPDVREGFYKKFGKIILEGYGTTELSPFTSCNQLDTPNKKNNLVGTVGKSVPGARLMIVDPSTLQELPSGEEGMITQGGVNVMKGYLNNVTKTREAVFTRNRIRWYQTGDKGKLDENGYVTILDRYSRFAKLGGEMVSLAAVEAELISMFNNEEYEFLAVATPDDKKGEIVSMLYNFDIDSNELKNKVNSSKMNNLLKPRKYFKIQEIPKLGSGKTDFSEAKKKVLEFLRSS
ncbi:MAG: acyl-[acyl-carrier-protein]-phospholipid O-acyltransferase [Francisellaceae bacterium]|jgi:acyl-[acyl-carrier-protein]-phospholipid O-acyltransferase/long-chain-fatty-acid--[acyl-carrier-protein] ligase